MSQALEWHVQKRDLMSIGQAFVAKHPKALYIPFGIFWIGLGIFDAFIKISAGDFKSGGFWMNAFHGFPPVCFALVGTLWILIGAFRIGFRKGSGGTDPSTSSG